ncbi:DUF4292 domain-containing protein [Aequorivita viscosa]|nr:DUF4292 domain-containing protein [Aequorivita viscosa]
MTNKLGNKERFILYDNAFFDRITQETSNDWAAISILAHEVGHHLNGHALNDEGSKHQWELEADEFSGFILARMGSNLEDAQSAVSSLKNENATATHPAKADRLAAVEKGWKRGSGKLFTDITITEEDIKNVEDDPVSPTPSSMVDSENKKLAQKVLAKYVEAIGGEENILKIRSIREIQNLYGETTIIGSQNSGTLKIITEKLTPSTVYNHKSNAMANYYLLYKRGKTYYKNKASSSWNFLGPDDKYMDESSFNYYHSLLIKNKNVQYVGKKVIKGTECHEIKNPTTHFQNDAPLFAGLYKIKVSHFFDTKSGYLKSIVRESIVTDKSNNISNYKTETYFDQYKLVDGIHFPFESKIISYVNGVKQTEINTAYEEIEVNPVLQKEHFNIK